MRPGKGASRPSVLAMNPNNREASAARRVKLLEAFLSLDEDTQADLLEAVETMSFTGTVGTDFDDARDIVRRMYAAAGWDQ